MAQQEWQSDWKQWVKQFVPVKVTECYRLPGYQVPSLQDFIVETLTRQ